MAKWRHCKPCISDCCRQMVLQYGFSQFSLKKCWYKQQQWGFHRNLRSRHGYLVPSPLRFKYPERGTRPHENRIQPHWKRPLEEVSGERWHQKLLTFSGRTNLFLPCKIFRESEKIARNKIKPAGKSRVNFIRFPVGNLESHRFPHPCFGNHWWPRP